ncbi:MAG: hypothetical protein C4533_07100 [Candidatus Omnitrophota bacterium]|jgi:hypothetical protein|nr:MAG: hypothetical protein C4533_07100 [Candidatus Omnitrophota bacterium]
MKKKFRVLIVAFSPIFFLLFLTITLPISGFTQETMTITTYYPSPFGSYRELSWGTGNTRGLLKADQGSSIELGGQGTPYIDFSNDMSSDFDVRLRLTDNNSLTVEGGFLYGGISCRLVTYSSTTGVCTCGDWDCNGSIDESNYWLAGLIYQSVTIPTSGRYLCCRRN